MNEWLKVYIEKEKPGFSQYPEILTYLENLSTILKKGRYLHTLGVVETSRKMAKAHGEDLVKAMTAAALHDYAKHWTKEALLDYAANCQLVLDAVMADSTELMHGFVGAEAIKQDFGIIDEDILNAIRYHTIGRADMSLLEKIVYLADAVEPGRDYPGVKQLRWLALEHLDQGILESVRSTLSYVLDKGQPMHPASVALYNELSVKLKNQGK